jgi:hypothetical protein
MAHAALLGSVAVYSGMFSVTELQPPPLTVTLVSPLSAISAPPAAGTIVHGQAIAPRPPQASPKQKTILEPVMRKLTSAPIFANLEPSRPGPEENQTGALHDQGGDTLIDVQSGSQRGAGGTIDGMGLDSERLLYPDPHLPEEFVTNHPRQTFVAVYRLCVQKNGSISRVTPIEGIADIDDTVVRQLKASWLYRPRAFPVCFARRFVFMID